MARSHPPSPSHSMRKSARNTGSQAAQQAEQQGRRGLIVAARAGYAARGFVYIVVGILALMAALGIGGETTGAKGAIRTILGMPFGEVLVGAVAVGLFGYALWRLVQGGLDADSHGTDAKGVMVRGGLIGSGLLHGALAFYAASLIWTFGGSRGGGGSNSPQGITAELMVQPFGRWLVAILGVIAIGAAGAQVIRAVKRKYRKWLDADARDADWLDPVARFGLAAKAVTMTLIGSFLITAAIQFDASEAKDLPAALDTLRQQPYGPWLLGVVAAGLIAFGIWGLVEARYRIIPQPDNPIK